MTPAFRLHHVNGDALRQARDSQLISQAVLALRSGLTIRTVSAAEHGCASKRTLAKLCGVLRIEPAALVIGPYRKSVTLDVDGAHDFRISEPR